MNKALVLCFWLLLASRIFFFLVNCFVSAVYMHPITTLQRISSLRTFTPRLIPRSLQFFVVISMRCLIALRIGQALASLSPRLTAPPHPSICFRTAAWLTYGGIYGGSLAYHINLFSVPFSWVYCPLSFLWPLWCMSQWLLMLFLLVQVSRSLTSLSSTIWSMST